MKCAEHEVELIIGYFYDNNANARHKVQKL